MAGRWATKIEIAGVSFTGCRGELLDPQGFKSAYVGSSEVANDFTPHVQVVNRGVRGISFGIKMSSAEASAIIDTLEAIGTAQSTNSTFVVEIEEEIYDINVNAVPDYNTEWFQHGDHSEGWYRDVIFRFISMSQGT
jgi:hypothetical protein